MAWRLEENLSAETYRHLLEIAEPLSCPQGAVLISEGDESRTLFIVESGSLIVSKQTGSGERQLATIEAGDVVGEIAFVDQRPRSATVTIREDARLLKLGHAEVMHALADHPAALADLIQTLAVRITLRFRDQLSEEDAQSELSKVSSISDAPAGIKQTGESYLDDLVEEALSHPAVCHPYLADLAEGNVPDLGWALRDFAIQYPGYCAHFPRYLTMVISKLESPGHRMTLMQNLVEESGMLDEEELAVQVEHGIEPTGPRESHIPKCSRRSDCELFSGSGCTNAPGRQAWRHERNKCRAL